MLLHIHTAAIRVENDGNSTEFNDADNKPVNSNDEVHT